jgi:hypothetical protein
MRRVLRWRFHRGSRESGDLYAGLLLVREIHQITRSVERLIRQGDPVRDARLAAVLARHAWLLAGDFPHRRPQLVSFQVTALARLVRAVYDGEALIDVADLVLRARDSIGGAARGPLLILHARLADPVALRSVGDLLALDVRAESPTETIERLLRERAVRSEPDLVDAVVDLARRDLATGPAEEAARRLSNLGAALWARWEVVGEPDALGECLDVSRRSADAASTGGAVQGLSGDDVLRMSPPPPSKSPARPCCSVSSAANSAPFTSAQAAGKACASATSPSARTSPQPAILPVTCRATASTKC